MAAELQVRVDTKGFNRLVAIYDRAGVNIKPAIGRAINHTGDKARTQVARALVKQTGLKYGRVRKALRTVRAGGGRMVYRIIATGGFISLKEFGPRQTRRGVSAAPWGKRRLFPHAFIAPTLGGHVFVRSSKARFPIKKLWGPAIPAEMVKDETKAAFERTVAAELAVRLQVEIDAILAGHTSAG